MEVVVRQFRDRDAEAVASLVRGTLKSTNAKDYPAEVIDRIAATWTPGNVKETAEKRPIFIATESEKVVGVGMLDDRIVALFVHHHYQKGGVGTKLADSMEQILRDRGVTETSVNSSISAKGFYRKRGYVCQEELDSEYAGVQDQNGKTTRKHRTRRCRQRRLMPPRLTYKRRVEGI